MLAHHNHFGSHGMALRNRHDGSCGVAARKLMGNKGEEASGPRVPT